jgi:macrolide-specific efflux system membrane fusion protein
MSVLSELAGRLPRAARPTIRLTNVLLLAALCALAAVGYFAINSTPAATKATPRTSPVAKGVVLSSVSAAGTVQTARDLSVNFQTSGRVTDVAVTAGQTVAKGQILGRLDPTDAKAAVSQAEASLASARANLAQAESGETAQQRTADAISLQQGQAAIRQAEASLTAARSQLRADDATTKQSVTSARSGTTVAQNEKQLSADRGNLAASVAKLKTDTAKLTIGGTTYASADDATNALTNVVTQDKSKQQADTQTNFDLQTQQTIDQQQLASDQNSLKNASNPSDQASWQSKVDSDQATVNADALKQQQLLKQLNADQYQLAQDESTQQTVQTLQTTLTQDQSSIQSYEAKIVSDKNAIAAAQSNQKSQLQTAESTRSSTLTKDRQAIVTSQQQVASAKLGLKSTAANNAVKSTTPPATLAQDRASVLQADVSLQAAQRTLGQTVLRAPAAGTVSAVSGVIGESVSGGGTSSNSTSSSASSSTGGASTTGTTSSSSSGFVELVNLRGLQVTGSFSESDAAKIRLGQAGTITVSALPNEKLAAHVIAIATTGTTSSGVVQYTVTLALDNTVAGLKPGMSANASVTTGERDNVLNVPNAAVTGTGSNATVKVMTNGVQSTVNVIAGLVGDSTTEIQSGLKAGQQVVTSSGVVATTGAGATVTPGAARGFGGGGFGGGGGGGVGIPGG